MRSRQETGKSGQTRFTSVPELELAIDLYVAQHNLDPKPFIWTASASDILAKVTRAKATLANVSR